MGRVVARGRSVVLTRLGRVEPSTSEGFTAYLRLDHDRWALTVEDVGSGFDTGRG